MKNLIKTVVVTAIGSFSADIVIKTLKRKGIRVVGCDIYPAEWIADSENVDQFYKVPYAREGKAYVDAILTICRREGAGALMVLTDAEVDVVNGFRDEFARENVILCLPSAETIALCRDKNAFARFLEQRNIGNTIPTMRLDEAEEDGLIYPVVVKPFNGRSSEGLSIVGSEEELKALKARSGSENFLVQPFLEGSIVTADVVRQADSGETVVICRRELLRTKNGAGTSVRVFRNETLEAECREVAKALQINGCVNFEFIEGADGRYHILECNPRFSGGVEFSCMAGYDCVTNHLNCFLGEKIEDSDQITGMYIARKYEEYITRVCEEGAAEDGGTVPSGAGAKGENGGNHG